jgi:hypothetical protein
MDRSLNPDMVRNFLFFVSSKFLIYKTILKSIWAYGIQLWGTASTSNIKILERFQSKALRMITDAPWYLPNMEGSPNPNGYIRNQPLQLPLQQAPQRAPKLINLKPTGTNRNKAIAKELANRSAYQIQCKCWNCKYSF